VYDGHFVRGYGAGDISPLLDEMLHPLDVVDGWRETKRARCIHIKQPVMASYRHTNGLIQILGYSLSIDP
jgi:hypothetical protein